MVWATKRRRMLAMTLNCILNWGIEKLFSSTYTIFRSQIQCYFEARRPSRVDWYHCNAYDLREPAQNDKGLRSRAGIRWFLLSASVWRMKKTITTRWNGLAADSAKVRNAWIISLNISFSVEIQVRCSLLRRPNFVVELENNEKIITVTWLFSESHTESQDVNQLR